jgi:hypothetical protein
VTGERSSLFITSVNAFNHRVMGEGEVYLCNVDPRVRPLFYCVQCRRRRKNPAYNLDCTQVIHARNGFKSRLPGQTRGLKSLPTRAIVQAHRLSPCASPGDSTYCAGASTRCLMRRSPHPLPDNMPYNSDFPRNPQANRAVQAPPITYRIVDRRAESQT